MLFSFIKYKLKSSLFELTFIKSKTIFLNNFNNLNNFEKIKNKERKEKKIQKKIINFNINLLFKEFYYFIYIFCISYLIFKNPN